MSKLSKAMPLLSTIVGFFVIGAVAGYKIYHFNTLLEQVTASITYILYVVWALSEIRISVGELAKDEAKSDRLTTEFCSLVKWILLLSLFLGTRSLYIERTIIGIVIMIIGISIRTYAVNTLGKAYSHRIRGIKMSIIKDGPYKIIRHPAYMGTAIAHTGIVLVFLNTYSLIALLLWYFAVILRTTVEERQLLKQPEYCAYTQEVRSRLMPGIW